MATTNVNSNQLGVVTTKGDLLTHATAPARLPVGTDGQMLVADAATATGLNWADAGDNPGDLFIVTDFGAVGDGTTDDTAAIQAAIDAAEADGGGVVYFPVGMYRTTATLTVDTGNVRLEGSGRGSQLLPVGTFDSLTIWSGSTTELFGCAIRDLFINDVNKTGGRSLYAAFTSGLTIENVLFDQGFDGVEFHNFNSLKLYNMSVVSCSNSFHMRLTGGGVDDVTNFGSEGRSDVARLVGVILGGTFTAGVDGLVIDGQVATVNILGTYIVQAGGDGVRVQNTITATRNPEFITSEDLEVDFPRDHAIHLIVGSRYNFKNSLCHGSRTTRNIEINDGVTAVTFSGGSVTGATQEGLYIAGREVSITGLTVSGNSNPDAPATGTLNTHAGIRLAATARRVSVVACTSGLLETAGYQSYGIQIDAGADEYAVTNNNVSQNATGGILNNGGQFGTRIVMLNPGAANTDNIFRHDHAGLTFVSAENRSTGPSVEARFLMATGTGNSFFITALQDVSGSPQVIHSAGPAVLQCFYDCERHIFRSTSGTERFRVRSNGACRFQPLSSDPAGAAAGDVYFNSTTNKLRVFDGTTWFDLH